MLNWGIGIKSGLKVIIIFVIQGPPSLGSKLVLILFLKRIVWQQRGHLILLSCLPFHKCFYSLYKKNGTHLFHRECINLSIKISEVLNKEWFITLCLQSLLKVLQTGFMASCFIHYYSKEWRQKFKMRNWDRMLYFQIYSEVDYNFHFKSSSFLAHVHYQRIHSFSRRVLWSKAKRVSKKE